MKFTLSWLKTHLDTNAALDEIADTLTELGLEVEEIANPADRLKGFTVGLVIEAEPHPDADKLRVCKVETGGGHAADRLRRAERAGRRSACSRRPASISPGRIPRRQAKSAASRARG